MALMQAFRFQSPELGLTLEDVPVPKPLDNQILVEVKAAGLCHTDCNIISGKDNTFFWKRPITLGHEIAGKVVQIGSEVTRHSVGDRVVAVIGTQHPISFGDVTTSAGIGYDGGFARYVAVFDHKALAIPAGVSFAEAAVATDAIATAYHAVKVEAAVTSGSKVAIIGLGGLGLSAVQLAATMGAQVYGIELDARKFIVATQAGAYVCAKSFSALPGMRFDVVIDFAGAGSTTAAAAKAVKPGGKVILVGLGNKETTLDTYEFIANAVTLVGSAGSSTEEVAACLDMIARKEIRPLLEEIPFSELRAGLERLSLGSVVGRLYVDPSKS